MRDSLTSAGNGEHDHLIQIMHQNAGVPRLKPTSLRKKMRDALKKMNILSDRVRTS
jgi:hypothetical protein